MHVYEVENRLLYCDTSWNWVTEHEKHILWINNWNKHQWSFNWKGKVGSDHDIMLVLNRVICFVNLLHIYYLAMFWGFIDNI